MSTLEEAGRIVDRNVFTALDWQPGLGLELTIPQPGVLSIRPAQNGQVAMTADQFFRIPVRLRRRSRLPLGVRVLLIGHRTHHLLLVYPPAALDVLCAEGLRLFEEAGQ
ncbi:AbrB/MazE/SpoVT family DNA-binding domain-containing protein [Nocardia arizonensis]|uniref:AbrB/MazE/SpoVT family DNA-binding domain-containing protein n=1 Tax=Nocardia arizonensis TaxID=1141647 RepID=UPI0012E14BE9|nr:AbrB/MazE/SpoVT family DNA-binding domain-containing protein [Nocardia arizonensis]